MLKDNMTAQSQIIDFTPPTLVEAQSEVQRNTVKEQREDDFAYFDYEQRRDRGAQRDLDARAFQLKLRSVNGSPTSSMQNAKHRSEYTHRSTR